MLQCPHCAAAYKESEVRKANLTTCRRCGRDLGFTTPEEPDSAGAAEPGTPGRRAPAVAPARRRFRDGEPDDPDDRSEGEAEGAGAGEARRPRRGADPVGALALLLSGIALVCASLPSTGYLVLPLALVAVLAGVGALTVTRHWFQARPHLPLLGTVVGAAVLAVALLAPGTLGPAYQNYRGRGAGEPRGIQAVTLPGVYTKGEPGLPEDGINASTSAARLKGVKVQLTAVTRGPVELRGAGTGEWTKESYLKVVVHTERSGKPRELDRRWDVPGLGDPAQQPVLTDPAGREYARVQRPELDPGGLEQRVSTFPVALKDEILYFEAPPSSPYLRLDLPAAAWGGEGTYRFIIPRAMIRIATGPKAPAEAKPVSPK